MTQTIITSEGCKEESNLERLYRIRREYYLQIRQELKDMDIRRNQLVKSYTIRVKDLDYDIDNELRRMKKSEKEKLLNKLNKV